MVDYTLSLYFDGSLGSGAWRELTGVVNKLTANLTNLVWYITLVIKVVALGDLSKQIEVDGRGEILDLKNTVNGMVIRSVSSLCFAVVGHAGLAGGRLRQRVPGHGGCALACSRCRAVFVIVSHFFFVPSASFFFSLLFVILAPDCSPQPYSRQQQPGELSVCS